MKIKMLLFDKDGTLVKYPVEPYFSSWDAFSLIFSDEEKETWFGFRESYIDKPELYDEWFSKQVGFLKGLKVSEIEKVLFPMPYSKGVEEFFKNLNGNYIKGIVSSGIDIVAQKICEEQNLDFFVSNILHTEKGVFNGKGIMPFGLHEKLDAVKKISEDYGISLENICFVGDSFNDVPVLKEVGLPISFQPQLREVKDCSKYVINDFRELNPILEQVK